jgi:hypothetical protein
VNFQQQQRLQGNTWSNTQPKDEMFLIDSSNPRETKKVGDYGLRRNRLNLPTSNIVLLSKNFLKLKIINKLYHALAVLGFVVISLIYFILFYKEKEIFQSG